LSAHLNWQEQTKVTLPQWLGQPSPAEVNKVTQKPCTPRWGAWA